MDKQVRKHMLELVETFKEIIEKSTEDIYKNNISEGIELITVMFEALLENKTINVVFSKDIVKLTEISTIVIEGLSNNDFIMITDLLEYQVMPIFDEWSLLLKD